MAKRLMALARPSEPSPDSALGGWGDPAQVPHLSDAVRALLRDGLGVHGPADRIGPPELPPPRLSGAAVAALEVAIGAINVSSDADVRLRHTRGRSTTDLLRLRAGDVSGAPDLVLFPASHDEVIAVLAACSERRIAVVPYGGGSSVVAGLEPVAEAFAGVVALDVRRLNALVALDEVSRLAVLEPGLRGPEAETLLGARGYTLGHFPQSFEYATLGGFAATRSSGQASAGYGRFDELVLGLRAATPVGTLELGRAPRTAAGPDLRQLLLGSEGAFGVLTELTLQVCPVPESRHYEGWRFPFFSTGIAAVRELAQDGPRPTVLRLSDEAETALNLAQPAALGRGGGAGALAIVGFEGRHAGLERRRQEVAGVLARHGGEPDADAGPAWARDRFRGPYLRDALLEAGALVETLETASFWSALPALYAQVSEALRASLSAQGTPPVILCHVSHVYATGASLYFTVGCAQLSDPVSQWRAAKDAASEAILTAGGSITHHHGVGRDHQAGHAREMGPMGVRMLAAVKQELDPAGILNPGVLLPGALS